MSITRNDSNTIHLGGDITRVNDLAVSTTTTPGMLLERFISAGVVRWRPSTGNGTAKPPAVALDHTMANKSYNDTYAANDLCEVGILHKGATAWMFIASGQSVNPGDLLGDAGSSTAGTLKTSPTVALFTALEAKTNNGSGGAGALTRVRVEAL